MYVRGECVAGQVFGSSRCSCHAELESVLARLGAEGRGVLIYVRQPGGGLQGLSGHGSAPRRKPPCGTIVTSRRDLAEMVRVLRRATGGAGFSGGVATR